MFKSIILAAIVAFADAKKGKKERGKYSVNPTPRLTDHACLETGYATCTLTGDGVSGTFNLKEKRGSYRLNIESDDITGLTEGLHGFHIHEFGDVSGDCAVTGGHWNPKDNDHGEYTERRSKRHIGDMKMIDAAASGATSYDYTDHIASLYGKYSVAGRSLAIHAGEDDFGQPFGNAGSKVACCTIAWTPEPEPESKL